MLIHGAVNTFMYVFQNYKYNVVQSSTEQWCYSYLTCFMIFAKLILIMSNMIDIIFVSFKYAMFA